MHGSSPVLPRGVLVPEAHLPSSRDVKETNFVLRFGAREVIQRFISLLGQEEDRCPNRRAMAPTEEQRQVSNKLLLRPEPGSGLQQDVCPEISERLGSPSEPSRAFYS